MSEPLTEAEAHQRYIKAINKGILKVMAKMGISTYQSYCGTQIFDTIGLATPFVDRYFSGTHSLVEGVNLIYRPEAGAATARYHCEVQDHGLAGALDHALIEQAKPALERAAPVRIETASLVTDSVDGLALG